MDHAGALVYHRVRDDEIRGIICRAMAIQFR